MPPMLRVIQPRPVEEGWKCKQSGDCCTTPREVIMTKEEAAVIVHAAPEGIVMHFRPTDREGFVALKAKPCPLFVFNGCLVYHSRPYNCRRFACMRPDPKTEKFEESEDGCLNFEARIANSRSARRLAARIQNKAKSWALKHGWK